MGTEEMFYRSGGLIPIRPILEPWMSMIYGARHATLVERAEGFARAIFDSYQVKKGDVLIINNC